MANLFKPLFNQELLESHLKSYTPQYLTAQQKQILQDWTTSVRAPAFRLEKEKPLQGQFLTDIFGRLLGYHPQVGHLDGYHLRAESASAETKGSKTPDGRLGFYGPDADHTRVVIELKSPAADLDAKQSASYGKLTPIEQAFGYLSKFDDCRWVIVSNFVTLRLYSKQRGQGYGIEFNLADLENPDTLKAFLYLLGRDRLIAQPPQDSTIDQLLASSTSEDLRITKEFYKYYKDLRLKLFRALRHDNPPVEPATIPGLDQHHDEPTEAHDILLLEKAQKILDRVLFICFCEDTGLLPKEIIKTVLEQAAGSVLSTSRWEHLCGLFRAVDQGHPPLNINGYNGGLFRADPQLDALTVDDDIINDVLALSTYNFRTRVNVSILGHIFEQSITDLEAIRADIQGQTLDKTTSKRKKEGVFYTPDTITQYIVAHTIGTWLDERYQALLEKHDVPNIPEAHHVKLRNAQIQVWRDYQDVLRTIKVLDPACGSGAFLIAAFDYLHAEYTRANEQLELIDEHHMPLFDLDKLILQQNLYGVDLNPESVEITKLSLWLKTARTDKPLNNLDQNIKCGNSLISPHPDLPPDLANRAFHWPAEFPDILQGDNPGFDVVIGNPPYIRQEWLAPCKPAFQREFRTYAGTADAYLYFFERGLHILKPGGSLGYITSGTFHSTNFAKPFRQWLPSTARFMHVVDFGNNNPFEDADIVSPMISILQKDATPRTFRYYFMRDKIPDSIAEAVEADGIDCDDSLFTQDEWRFQDRKITRLLDKLMATGRPLGDGANGEIYRGVLTGCNDAFLIDEATKDALIAKDATSAEIIKPLLRGQDLRPWYYQNSGTWLIFTRRGIDIDAYPAVRDYLETFRERLEPRPDDWEGRNSDWPGRKPGPYHWYEIQDSVDYYPAFDKPKILWPDIAKLPRFSLDTASQYLNNTGYVMPCTPDMLAILQSRVLWLLISQIATPLQARAGLWRFRCINQFMSRLPIPDTTPADREALSELAQQATQIANQRYQLHEQIRHRILTDLADGDGKLNQKLTTWWELDFPTFRQELKKALKTDIPLKERQAWEDALQDWQADHQAHTNQLIETETAINDRVYHLFHLTSEEQKTLHAHMEHAMIDYPLGEV